MPIVISHNDADGIISIAALFMKYPEKKFSVYFATPSSLKLVLCKAISKARMGDELFIFDLSPNQETAKLASFFETTWIDHHIWEDVNFDKNVKAVNDTSYPSAASLAAKYLGVDGKIFELADEIDRNNVKSEEAYYLRDLIDGIRFIYGKAANVKLKAIASRITKGFENIKTLENDGIVEKFREFIKEVEEKVEKEVKFIEKDGIKIAFYVTSRLIPARVVLNKVKEMNILADIVAVFYYYVKNGKMMTKIEFRSANNYDVFEIAKRLGGGGHKYASGATVEGFLKIDDILEMISSTASA
jgi:nanoRNase/pAp phosphatase (c-di-AMP/oligoRNAs hydrolase)